MKGLTMLTPTEIGAKLDKLHASRANPLATDRMRRGIDQEINAMRGTLIEVYRAQFEADRANRVCSEFDVTTAEFDV